MRDFKVDRCVCHKITFSEIRKKAIEQDLDSIDDLQKKEISSTNCGMCIPYIRLMFETGRVEFVPGEYINTPFNKS